ncbi:MAG: 50S ribosomal protein L25 [Patescibacteria group bacterium]
MQLKAEKRQELGKKTKTLKQENKIPAVIFGKGMDSLSITLDHNEFVKVFEEEGETNIIDIVIGSETYKVLVKEYQLNPVTDKLIHVSFYKPDLTIKTQVQVPVNIIGEEENELIKNGEAFALLLMQEITVEALPTDLPNEFIVDVSELTEFGQGINISQLKYDREKVEIPDIDPEEFVVRLDEVTIEEEPEEEVSEEAALEGIEATEETAAEEIEGGEEGKPEAPAQQPQESSEKPQE